MERKDKWRTLRNRKKALSKWLMHINQDKAKVRVHKATLSVVMVEILRKREHT